MNYSLGKRIKMLRKNLGLRQEDISCDILSRTMLSRIETDKATPSIHQLKYLSAVLNVSVDFLLDETLVDLTNDNIKLSDKNLYNLYENKLFLQIISLYESNKIKFKEDINFFYFVGSSYFEMEFYNQSYKILKKYVSIISKSNLNTKFKYKEYYLSTINLLSIISFKNNNINNAIKYTLLGKVFLEDVNLLNTDCYLKIINNLGVLYNSIYKYRKSINITRKFLDMSKEQINMKYISGIYLNLNVACYNIGNYDGAIEYIKIAMFFYKYCNKMYDYKECYINLINSYRYSSKFNTAFELLSNFKKTYYTTLEPSLKYDFIIEEAILYFNIENYSEVEYILSNLNLNQLNQYNRNTYEFMKGHLAFLNKDYSKAKYFLNRCKGYFFRRHYFYDLSIIYHDLYIIDNNDKYLYKLKDIYLRNDFKKNVLIEYKYYEIT